MTGDRHHARPQPIRLRWAFRHSPAQEWRGAERVVQDLGRPGRLLIGEAPPSRHASVVRSPRPLPEFVQCTEIAAPTRRPTLDTGASRQDVDHTARGSDATDHSNGLVTSGLLVGQGQRGHGLRCDSRCNGDEKVAFHRLAPPSEAPAALGASARPAGFGELDGPLQPSGFSTEPENPPIGPVFPGSPPQDQATCCVDATSKHSLGSFGVIGNRARPGGAHVRLMRALGRPLVAILGITVCQAQFGVVDPEREQAEEERLWAEHEDAWLLESIQAAKRESAHMRLEDAASSIQSQALCPAFLGLSPEPRTSRKRISSPFVARFAPPPVRTPWRGVAADGDSASGIFDDYISDSVVQSKCINCHVEGGPSGHTRLVLTPSGVDGHEATNLAVFQNFLDSVEGGADLILNKIQGAEAHGGGVQVVSGSIDFANMERFLRALGGDVSGGLSPDTLFEGVTMAPPWRVLRRAALLFAGRLPTESELGAVSGGDESSLRQTIKGLMTGPGFHDFLVRSANDRLLTDRERFNVIGLAEVRFVDLTNKRWELAQEGIANGYADYPRRYPGFRQHERAVQYGVARAPLELVAHVVENDLPYTEILTADYIMANPMAAAAYGATTEFDDPEDVTEFKPSEIARYFRRDRSMIVEENPPNVWRVINPGNLSTDYPHAGVLNTTVFLRRYPTTATNRNRARSRWTYYQFLGFDIEKSAARTQDADALADTNNPTMNNPACTVCHIPMDPVAGTYQNYGDNGLFRDRNAGRDALPNLYRSPRDGTVSPYQRGDTWFRDMRAPGFGDQSAPSADNSLQWLAEQMVADERFAKAAVRFWWPAVMGVELVEPPSDSDHSEFDALLVASAAQTLEVDALAQSFRDGFGDGDAYNAKDLLTEIALSPWFRAESVTGDDETRATALRNAGVARLLTPEELAAKTDALSGYVWGRRFQKPFGPAETRSKLHDPQGYTGYQLLYGGIDSDGIIERTGDITPLMAAVAQSHAAEVSCPIVRREFFYWPEENRLLFDGITKFDTPYSEMSWQVDITSESWATRQAVTFPVSLAPGAKTVRLSFTNDFRGNQQDSDGNRPDRNLKLDRLLVTDSSLSTVAAVELETLGRNNCGRPDGEYYLMTRNCSLEIPVEIASAGDYSVVVVAHQDKAGDEAARLAVELEAEDGSSQGEVAIRRKLADLHQKLFGVAVAVDSPDVDEAYSLFLEVWNRKRDTEGGSFGNSQFHCTESGDHFYFDGFVDDARRYNQYGGSQLNFDLIRPVTRATDTSDPQHAVRTWVVTLAYLLTDYRYLYF